MLPLSIVAIAILAIAFGVGRGIYSYARQRSADWRRLVEWEGEDVLVKIWHSFLDTLDEQGLLDWDEVFVDASFSPAKKGATESAKPSGERVQSGWWWRMVREFHSHAGPKVLRLLRSRWSKPSSMKSLSPKHRLR